VLGTKSNENQAFPAGEGGIRVPGKHRSGWAWAAFASLNSGLSIVIAMLVIATMLAGCGFKLRGQAALPFESVYIETGGFSLLGAELRRVIRAGGKTRIADQPEDAEVILRIVGEQQEKHVLSLSIGGKVREFELRYRLAYRLLDRAARDIVPPGQIELRRDLTYDDTQVLAKESEEALLYEDMKSDAVQQMLRRLAVIKLPS